MTDINKQMEKKAHDWAMTGNNVSDYNTLFYSFKKGYDSALHDSRWRKVSDELPKVASKPYCIVVRDDDGRVQLEWILVGYDEGVISFLLDKYVEWKPID